MVCSRQISNIHEVVLDAAVLYERALGIGDHPINVRREADGKCLGHKFSKRVDQADRPKVFGVFCIIGFGN
jgi:hypothetical protein